MKQEMRCHYQPWSRLIQLAVFVTDHDSKRKVAAPLTLRDFNEGEYLGEPTITMRPEEGQELMDELWRCGLRPSEGSGSAGSLKATESHLADMRVLVASLTGAKL